MEINLPEITLKGCTWAMLVLIYIFITFISFKRQVLIKSYKNLTQGLVLILPKFLLIFAFWHMIYLTASYEEVLFGSNMRYEFFYQMFLQHQEFIYSRGGEKVFSQWN